MAMNGIGAGLAGIGAVRAALAGTGVGGAGRLAGRVEAAAQELSTGRHADTWGALGPRGGEAIGLRIAAERNDALKEANRVLDGTLASVEDALGEVRAAGQSVMEQLAMVMELPAGSRGHLALVARDAIGTIVERTGVRAGGGHPLSGVAIDRPPLRDLADRAAPGAMSPMEGLAEIVDGGLADAADAAAKAADMAALFANAHPDPALSFDALFYGGDAARGPDGRAAEALSWTVSEDERLALDVRADDPAMRDVLRGLSMLAAAPADEITDEGAAKVWMEAAMGALSSGLDGLVEAEMGVGLARGRLEGTMEAQERRSLFLARQSDVLEGVDPFEAGTRLQALVGQIEASYAVTARLGRLSFLDYM